MTRQPLQTEAMAIELLLLLSVMVLSSLIVYTLHMETPPAAHHMPLSVEYVTEQQESPPASMELLPLLLFVAYNSRVAIQCSSVRSLPASIMARQPPQTEAMELLPLLSVMVLSSLIV